MGQDNWAWCHKCQGLFYTVNPGSVCPAGGEHEKPAKGTYVLLLHDDQAQVVGQDDGTAGAMSAGVLGESQSAAGYGVIGITCPGFPAPGFIRSVAADAFSPGGDHPRLAGVLGINWGLGIDGGHQYNAAVLGRTDTQSGVIGISDSGRGVWGLTDNSIATVGDAIRGTGVWGHSRSGPGVHAESDSFRGIEARGNPAGHFDGNVEVTGNLQVGDVHGHDVHVHDVHAHDVILDGADCAEHFEVDDPEGAVPGTVMVIGNASRLEPCRRPYDKRVAGVLSGAGAYRPGIVLDRPSPTRRRLGLVGKVYCQVDAGFAPIDVGDLLTTSPNPGHAMKATEPARAFGSVLGKSLASLEAGTALLPILVTLQ